MVVAVNLYVKTIGDLSVIAVRNRESRLVESVQMDKVIELYQSYEGALWASRVIEHRATELSGATCRHLQSRAYQLSLLGNIFMFKLIRALA